MNIFQILSAPEKEKSFVRKAGQFPAIGENVLASFLGFEHD
jgi:hypothetical protein